MKFQGHLSHDMPVLEDVLGGAAAIVHRDDGSSARVRLDVVGRHRVAAGGAAPQIMEALAIEPLTRVGLSTTDVDDFATELHNPEITEPQGSGNVPERNYRTIAALAPRRGDIDKAGIPEFVRTRRPLAPSQRGSRRFESAHLHRGFQANPQLRGYFGFDRGCALLTPFAPCFPLGVARMWHGATSSSLNGHRGAPRE